MNLSLKSTRKYEDNHFDSQFCIQYVQTVNFSTIDITAHFRMSHLFRYRTMEFHKHLFMVWRAVWETAGECRLSRCAFTVATRGWKFQLISRAAYLSSFRNINLNIILAIVFYVIFNGHVCVRMWVWIRWHTKTHAQFMRSVIISNGNSNIETEENHWKL